MSFWGAFGDVRTTVLADLARGASDAGSLEAGDLRLLGGIERTWFSRVKWLERSRLPDSTECYQGNHAHLVRGILVGGQQDPLILRRAIPLADYQDVVLASTGGALFFWRDASASWELNEPSATYFGSEEAPFRAILPPGQRPVRVPAWSALSLSTGQCFSLRPQPKPAPVWTYGPNKKVLAELLSRDAQFSTAMPDYFTFTGRSDVEFLTRAIHEVSPGATIAYGGVADDPVLQFCWDLDVAMDGLAGDELPVRIITPFANMTQAEVDEKYGGGQSVNLNI